jgi:hypothetical protein
MDGTTICGFSFGRNLSNLKYPVEASVRSVLPACDRFVFAVGASDDDTRRRVESIAAVPGRSGRPVHVEIVDTTWPQVYDNGEVLAIEANKALDAAEATGCTWGFYIQADEVIHEDDLAAVVAAAEHWQDDAQVKALLFHYLHFVMDYGTTDPWMYHKASRVLRLDGSCRIVGDACGPAFTSYEGPANKGNGYLDKHHMGGHVRWAADPATRRRARVFHYGWVKTRQDLKSKMGMVQRLWWGSLQCSDGEQRGRAKLGRLVSRYPILKKYRGTHPAVMADHVKRHEPFARVVSRWLNPHFYREVLAHGFHG